MRKHHLINSEVLPCIKIYSNIYIFFCNSLGSVKLSEALFDERKPNQVSWANKVPSPDYLPMVMTSTSSFGFSFLEEKYSKDVSTYEGLYSMPFSNQNMDSNCKPIHALRSRN